MFILLESFGVQPLEARGKEFPVLLLLSFLDDDTPSRAGPDEVLVPGTVRTVEVPVRYGSYMILVWCDDGAIQHMTGFIKNVPPHRPHFGAP